MIQSSVLTGSSYRTIMIGIERALITSVNWCIPQRNCSGVKSRKVWWDDELTRLKSRAQLCFKVWRNLGKPLDGAEYMEMQNSKKEFKRKIKQTAFGERNVL